MNINANATAPRASLRLSFLAAVAAVAVLTLLARGADRRLATDLAEWDSADNEERVYVPPPLFLEVASLGYRNALGDALWFRTLDYFGKHYNRDKTYTWLTQMLDRIVDLDPGAAHVYRFAAFILPWEANQVDDSLAILEKGTRALPDSWELWYFLGFNYYFFKDDLASASAALRQAAKLKGVHPAVITLASTVEATSAGSASAINFLQSELERTEFPEVRLAIEGRIHQLMITEDIDALEAAAATFQALFLLAPSNFEDLISLGIIQRVPKEPHGGLYVLEPGTARVLDSLGIQPSRLRGTEVRDKMREKTNQPES